MAYPGTPVMPDGENSHDFFIEEPKDLEPQPIAEALAKVVVTCDGAI